MARTLSLVPSPKSVEDNDGDLPKLRVAMATQDGKAVNAHFGSARRFVIYEITPRTSRFVATTSFDDTSDESGSHQAEGDIRIAKKVEAISGCNLLFVRAIGGPSAARVIKAQVHPVKLAESEAVEQVIAKVQALMTSDPPPWMRKALSAAGAQRSMDFLEDD